MTLSRLYQRLAAIDALIVSLEEYRRSSRTAAASAVAPAKSPREGATWGGIAPLPAPLRRATASRAAAQRSRRVYARSVLA